jgi:hypothetical protein
MPRIDANKTAELTAVLHGSTPNIRDAVAAAIEIQREAFRQCKEDQDPINRDTID